MDSLNTILSSKDFQEPDELNKLKTYIAKEYNYQAEIRVHPKGLVVIVGSSALAATLRLRLPEIKRVLEINSPIILRIT